VVHDHGIARLAVRVATAGRGVCRGGAGQAVPVLIFDRGGAFPEAMAELRNLGAEFITYERPPYPMLAPTEFTEELQLRPVEHRPDRAESTFAQGG